MSNYPAGVSDSHPHFNPAEGSVHVECTSDESPALPYYAVKQALDKITMLVSLGQHDKAESELEKLSTDIDEWKMEDCNYECQFADVMDVDISEEAEWQCPRCGSDNTSDTLPEERDPDEEWERRNER